MAKDKEEKKDGAAEKAEVAPEEAAAKSKKRKLLFIIIGGVVLTGGIGAGLAFFLAGGDGKMAAKSGEEAAAGGEHAAEPAAEQGKAEAKAEGGEQAEAKGKEGEGKAEAKGKEAEGKDAKGKDGVKVASKVDGVDFGCTQTFQPFHLNLGNPLENRYIRLEVAIEYGCQEELKAELDKRLPQLRDAVISVTSRKTREFLLGPDGKEQLRKEIHTRINQYMSRKVDDVYITDILIE